MDSNHRPSGYEPDELPLLHTASVVRGVHRPTLPAGNPPVPSALQRFTSWFGMEQRGSTALHTHPPPLLPIGRVAFGGARLRAFPSPVPRLRIAHPLSLITPLALLHSVRGTCKEALDSAPPSPLPLTGPPARAACPGYLPGVLPGYTSESTHLEAHFPLRCFQRLMVPNIATEPAGRPTTPPPAVRPARSSRTRASPSQCSQRS